MVAHFISYKLEIVLSNHVVSTFDLYISLFGFVYRVYESIHSVQCELPKINLHSFLESEIVARESSQIVEV